MIIMSMLEAFRMSRIGVQKLSLILFYIKIREHLRINFLVEILSLINLKAKFII